jgi:hypothetical protein
MLNASNLLQAFTDEARGMQVTPAVAAKDQLNVRVHQPHPDNGTRPARHENQKTNEILEHTLRILTSTGLIEFQVLMNTTTPLA